jgi:hypothetical protein
MALLLAVGAPSAKSSALLPKPTPALSDDLCLDAARDLRADR